jgi:hypothetical protein
MPPSRQRTSMQIVWDANRQVYKVSFEASEETFHDVVRALKRIDLEPRSYNSVTHLWSIHPAELDALRQIATTYFDDAQLTEGSVTTNLHTGRATEQLRLFG